MCVYVFVGVLCERERERQKRQSDSVEGDTPWVLHLQRSGEGSRCWLAESVHSFKMAFSPLRSCRSVSLLLSHLRQHTHTHTHTHTSKHIIRSLSTTNTCIRTFAPAASSSPLRLSRTHTYALSPALRHTCQSLWCHWSVLSSHLFLFCRSFSHSNNDNDNRTCLHQVWCVCVCVCCVCCVCVVVCVRLCFCIFKYQSCTCLCVCVLKIKPKIITDITDTIQIQQFPFCTQHMRPLTHTHTLSPHTHTRSGQ